MREKNVGKMKIVMALLIACSFLLMGLATPQMIRDTHSQLTKDTTYPGEFDEPMVITASQMQGETQDTDAEASGGTLGGLSVTKQIWDDCDWVDTIEANVGDILLFNITIAYTKICGTVANNVNVTDILPPCLSYVPGSGVITHGTNVYTGQSSISGQQIEWYLEETYDIRLYAEGINPLFPPHYVTIHFNAEVIDCTSPCGEHNQVWVDALEHCCGEPMSGYDEATIIVPCPSPGINLEKKVKDDCNWVDSVVVTVGDDVDFKLTVTNTGTIDLHHVNVTDDLPSFLTYNYDASITPFSASDHHIEWTLGTLTIGSSIEIFFSAHADTTGEGNNVAEVDTHEGVCDLDAVHVVVDLGPPDVELIKTVKDGSIWSDSTTASVGDDVEFKLLISNTGAIDLTEVHVVDNLPTFLVYNDDANITPLISTDHHIEWNLGTLLVGQSKEITFSAHACAVGNGDNVASVTTCQSVSDTDSAHVFVAGMTVEKQVWDDTLHTWKDEVDASVGETVRFRITISYIGDGTYDLYNIRVLDILPECLTYADNAIPTQTHVSGDGRTIWWNLSTHLPAGQSTMISFDALVTETSGCGPCVNWAQVTANECSGAVFHVEDDATVNAECPLVADAGGPYFGEIDTAITLSGSAIGGAPPYSYKWDLDDDGYYDDATGKTISHTWHSSGTFVISLKVTDDDGRWDIDDTTVTIAPPNNEAPTKPSQPSGPTTGTTGTTYTYSTSSTDPDGDTLRYGWDWNGDGTVDTWMGYYTSGQTVSQSHTWTTSGTYSVKVKAEDEHGGQSTFSNALSVTIGGNTGPSQPSITGPSSGKIDMSYTYTASSSDPDGDQVYYWFDWDDGSNSGWLGPYASGQSASASHVWTAEGGYSIKVKSKDSHGEESTWTTLSVTMPKHRFSGLFDGFLRLFESYPLLYRILQEFFHIGTYS